MKAVVYKDAYSVAAEAPSAYKKFDQRVDGYTKVLLHPAG